jgi:hypothetical protein
MNKRSYHQILSSAAADSLSRDTNLWPNISARLERKPLIMKLRTHPLAVILLVLFFLLVLSGVVYALGRSLGYIPGLGVVDQNAPFHVLAEPVSQTRDGVTVTIEKATMTTDKVLIVFKVEGLSPDKFSFLEPLDTCLSEEELRFPNGESVKPSGGGGSKPIDGGFESNYMYAPISLGMGMDEATLFIPCIHGALAQGILPEEWQLPLEFIPAPPDVILTVIPVVEVASPSALQGMTAMPSAVSPNLPDTDAVNPLVISQIIDTGDSYILIGEFNPPVPSHPGEDVQLVHLDVTDGNNQMIYYQVPSDMAIDLLSNKNKWAIELLKGFTPPLHITYSARYVIPADTQDVYVFEFDAGANPQQDQEWNVNQEFQLAGHTMRLVTISADNMPVPFDGSPSKYAYRFEFQTDDAAVNSLTVNIDGYTPNAGDPRNNYPNNYAEGDPLVGKFGNYVTWPQMPTGVLKVIFSNLYLNGELKSWTVDWQP